MVHWYGPIPVYWSDKGHEAGFRSLTFSQFIFPSTEVNWKSCTSRQNNMSARWNIMAAIFFCCAIVTIINNYRHRYCWVPVLYSTLFIDDRISSKAPPPLHLITFNIWNAIFDVLHLKLEHVEMWSEFMARHMRLFTVDILNLILVTNDSTSSLQYLISSLIQFKIRYLKWEICWYDIGVY